jgi:diketogulonate reductase-like aldo/keto reductase
MMSLLLVLFLVLFVFGCVKGTTSNSQQEKQRQEKQEQYRRHHRLDMETKEIAPGVLMPVVSIGTGGLESQKAYDIVSDWLALGGTGIDTALNYRNQDKVREAIEDATTSSSNNTTTISRDDLFLTTKIPDCNATETARKIETDLELLGTHYVDLVLIHGPRRGDCLAAWKVLEESYESNRTRAIGVSNFKRKDLEPLLNGGTVIPHVNQIKLNLLNYNNDDDTMDTIRYSTQYGILLEAYSPLGRGGGEVVHHPLVETIAFSHNVTGYQIALKWILQHGWILTFQSSSKEHQATDADVFGFRLTPEEMYDLDRIGEDITPEHNSIMTAG